MERFNIFPTATIKQPTTGQILIAEPLLNEPNFARAVILLCEHSDEGTVGFVINHTTGFTLGDLVKDIHSSHMPVFKGGPVQMDTLHMLHRAPAIINNGVEVIKGVYWGGSYDELKEMAAHDDNEKTTLRLFQGYSGWGPGQLEREISEGTWLIADATEQLLFDTPTQDIWKRAIQLLGPQYGYLTNMPIDPKLN